MASFFKILVITSIVILSDSHGSFKHPSPFWVMPHLNDIQRKDHKFWNKFDDENGSNSLLSNCTEKYITQYLDHYNYGSTINIGQTTFQQRYFICGGAKWLPNSTIFFYFGNEANVELFINHTGLMWENQDEFNAIMVFAEHRYYGKSLPFGSDQEDGTNKHVVFFTIDQALADYAVLLKTLKTEWNSWSSPIIGFGGSYGGMLCTWFITKYSQWIDGCIAASAPVVFYLGEHPNSNTNWQAQGLTYDCMEVGGNKNDFCADNFRITWQIIFKYANTSQGRYNLYSAFKLCEIPNDYNEAVKVVDWIINALGSLSMGSYPYSSNYFLNGNGNGYLPPYPMRLGCSWLTDKIYNKTNEEMTLLQIIRRFAGIFYNATGKETCFNISNDEHDIFGYLECTSQFSVSGQNGVTDMFWYDPANITASTKDCYDEWGYWPRELWPEINYGGWLPFKSGSVSNIVFSNGELDFNKWGGIYNVNFTDSNIYAIVIPDVGHHIDLMFSNPNDTQSVKDARQFELDQISIWIKNKQLTVMD